MMLSHALLPWRQREELQVLLKECLGGLRSLSEGRASDPDQPVFVSPWCLTTFPRNGAVVEAGAGTVGACILLFPH